MSSKSNPLKDFLQYTLANPQFIPEPFSFSIGHHTHVEVWDTGVIMFEPRTMPPSQAVKNLILSSAVHGNETAPIELCNTFISDLLAGKLVTQHRLLFLFGNPMAIIENTRFVEENLNRLFSGAHSKGEGLVNYERRRAKSLERHVARFFEQAYPGSPRLHYDLHTAIRGSKHEKFAIYPYREGKAYSGEQLMFLAACGINTVLFHHEPTTTFSYFSSHYYQADAFTIELGKVMPMGENDMTRFTALKQTLTALISHPTIELPDFDAEELELFQVHRSINKRSDDFAFTFSKDVENFTEFSHGHVLAIDGGEEIKVDTSVEAIVFPNANVPVGQRTVLCLVPAKGYSIS
ncbi:succinylglutamate desuccinylase [Shewanella sp. AS1]|uniref:succinylglutamate desuccinylase n=1 Tax=Shewanella sp. AS1 TaxID=2907626 RepID=UPI001F317EE1|nr:succinylglutamate desuccinylase [Shewanella sp. AS1]MCE9678735.1 succinylglutamate desuccinylase [Shewanella sp. AS1]